MSEPRSFLQELEDAVARGTPETRLRALWHATDVLIAGRFTEDEIWMFGEVINRLAVDIEHAARVRLSLKLAPSGNAPFDVVRDLAFDESIAVAGPVLVKSERLDVTTLVANARTKSQQHLLAISKRRKVPEEVTDVLVERGSAEVASSVAANDGARFSGKGFLHLVRRAEGDRILAERVGLRRDIPKHLFAQLIAKASDEVRLKLEQERPEMRDVIGSVVADVAGKFHARFGPTSKDYFLARRTVGELHRRRALNEDQVFEFAYSQKFNETAASIALLCDLPVDVVERAMIDPNREAILILAKALDFCWQTAMAVLFLGAPNYRITANELEKLKTDFGGLKPATSRQVLAVYRSRKQEGGDLVLPLRAG